MFSYYNSVCVCVRLSLQIKRLLTYLLIYTVNALSFAMAFTLSAHTTYWSITAVDKQYTKH